MSYGNPNRSVAQEYLKSQIENATPAQQLVMLFDGAIKFVLLARDAIGRGDIAGRYNANRRAMEIVGYLLEILDMDKGGEVALRLQRIYAHLLKKFLEVDVQNSQVVCDEVVDYLRQMRAGWQQIAEQASVGSVQAATVSALPQPESTAATAEGVQLRRNAVA